MKRAPKSVKVKCGDFSKSYRELVSMTVAGAKEFLKDKVELPDPLCVLVDDEVVDNLVQLEAGWLVEFKLATVRVICGANEVVESTLVDKSVAYARRATKEALNIPRGAKASLDGDEIERDQEGKVKLEADSTLEFAKEDGEKG